jgi:DNA-binding NarL/FixJ family response regulator
MAEHTTVREPVRVVVVDDQAVIRAGLRMIVDNEPDLTVVGEAGDGAEAVRVASQLRPDVVLMDVRMPEVDGIEATRRLLSGSGDAGEAACPAVLVLTTFEDDDYVFGALRAGASGFLLKDAGPDAVVDAIRAVARGDASVDPAVTRRLVERWAELDSGAAVRAGDAADPTTRATGDVGLTDREREILVGLASGLSNRELAGQLIVSEATVKSHVSNLLTKLGVRSRVQAVILAYERGIVRTGDRDLDWR